MLPFDQQVCELCSPETIHDDQSQKGGEITTL